MELHVHRRYPPLAHAHAPAEKARVQGANDFIVFAVMGVSSLAAGALVSSVGWAIMNRGALPFLLLVAVIVLWYSRHRGRAAAPP